VSAPFGRPSAASNRPWQLRAGGDSSTAGVRAEEGDTDRWSLRVASVAGVRHRLVGVGNEDAFAFAARPDGRLLVAVADGVGSVPGSARAAAVGVVVALASLSGGDGGGPSSLIGAVAEANDAVAALDGGACTLVVGQLTDDGAWTLARVGDSSAFVLGDGAWAEAFGPPVDDEGVPVATSALPRAVPDIEEAAGFLAPEDVLILTTDGVANPLRDGPTSVAPALAEALAEPPGALALAGITDFSRQGCFDDRTILAVWSRPSG
jgi:serine/threonine protein phosphatase PrpC